MLGFFIYLPNYQNYLSKDESIIDSYSLSHRSFLLNIYRTLKNEGIYYHINDLCPVDFGFVNLFEIQCYNSIPKSRLKIQVSNRSILVLCPKNCLECTSSICSKCNAGFYLNPDSLFCEPCSEKCNDCKESPDNCVFYANYFEALYKSVFFYDYQKSGYIEPQDQRVCWRYHSFLQDSGEKGEELVGGFFDSTGTLKINSHLCFLVTIFVYSLIEFETEFQKTMLYDQMISILRQTLEYLLKCYVDDKNIYFHCGEVSEEDSFWGRPEDFSENRKCFKIPENKSGTNFLANMSSAFSSGAYIFQSIDPQFYSKLKENSINLHILALSKPYDNIYDFFPDIKEKYGPLDGVEDDLFESSIWLDFLNNDNKNYFKYNNVYHNYKFNKIHSKIWSNRRLSINFLLYKTTKHISYFQRIEDYIQDMFSKTLTPAGFLNLWGNHSTVSSLWFSAVLYISFWALIISKDQNCTLKSEFNSSVLNQINYILGNNPNKTSYMIGYSNRYILNLNHKASSCKSPSEPCSLSEKTSSNNNPNQIIGAVLTGILNDDSVNDSRDNSINSTRLIDNVTVPGILARIFELYGDENNINPDQFPKSGKCLYNLFEYQGKYSSNVSLYELYKAGLIDSPFVGQNQGRFYKIK